MAGHALDDVADADVEMALGAIAAGRATGVPGLSRVTSERAPVAATVSSIRASGQT